MEYIEAIKIKRRMLKTTPETLCNTQCHQCGFSKINTGINIGCCCFEIFYPEEAEKILLKWNEENPLRTFLSVLLEAFPDAEIREDGIPGEVCPCHLGLESKCQFESLVFSDKNPCPTCWTRELVKSER